MSFETYATVFREPCRAVRFGDRFHSARAARLFAELGARFDLTVEPGAQARRSMADAPATGSLPSMAAAPRRPYHPSLVDPFRERATGSKAELALWMIPLTSMNPDPILEPWRRIARRVRHPTGPMHRPAALHAPGWTATTFWRSAEREVDHAPWPYLAFAVRSDLPIRPNLMRPFEEKIAALTRLPFAQRLVFTGPEELVASVPTKPTNSRA